MTSRTRGVAAAIAEAITSRTPRLARSAESPSGSPAPASGAVLRGRAGSGGRGAAVEFGEETALAMAAAVEAPMPRIPRPATTRFPVDVETFLSLKARAEGTSPAKRNAEIVADRRGRPNELAEGIAAMGAAPAAAAAAPGPLPAVANFSGLPSNGWLPYDGALAAGPEHVMLAVNATVGFYTKSTGAALFSRSLTAWFANVVTGAKIFDPKLLYDQFAGRWVLVAVALKDTPEQSLFLISISASADPRGRWFNYALDAAVDGATATKNWADYPGVGVDNSALYITANMFKRGGGFVYSKLRVIPKTGPYSGGAAKFNDFVRMKNGDGSFAFTMQPCHTFGVPGAQYFVNTLYPTTAKPSQDQLTVWTLRDPLGTATLTRSSIKIAAYSLPPDADQKGGGTPLDTGDIRVLNAVYSGGAVWCAFTTGHAWNGTNRAAFCWLQLRPSENRLLQQGIFGARDGSYFYPAVMPDVHGNVVLTFSRCSASEFASMYFTGRQTTDPQGQLRPSALLKAGAANYTGLDSFGRNRWGDYSGIGLDPADSRTVWFYNGYALAATQWATQVGAARF